MMSNHFSDFVHLYHQRGVWVCTHSYFPFGDFSERDFRSTSNANFLSEAQLVSC